MTADSVPAPMVQLPADKVEKLREELSVIRHWHGPGEGSHLYNYAKAVVDAATPAASVPAADILALAEHCEKVSVDSNESEQWQRAHTAFAGWLRVLVAAAEQADKGEAANTPRDDEDHGSRGWEATETGWRCTECHASVLGQIDAATDAAHRCRTTARVPVNDEAEAPSGWWMVSAVSETDGWVEVWNDADDRGPRALFRDLDDANWVVAAIRAARQGGNSDE